MRAIENIWHRLLAGWKWVLSFCKRDWEVEAYPIYVRRQKPDPDSPYQNNPRFKFVRYWARIINWNVDGGGDTRETAFAELREKFASRKMQLAQDGKPLPRPGNKVPIQFASQERVNSHPELKKDFTRRVLGLDRAFISDKSSLWDFHTEETNEALLAKIKEAYGVDVSDIESGMLCDIFDRIGEAGRTK